MFAGYLVIRHYIVELERKKKLSKDVGQYENFSMVLSELTILRKILFDHMTKDSINIDSPIFLYNNVSSKLQNFIKIIVLLKRSDVCLVFVDRRTTAKMLCHYIMVPIS